MQSTLIASADSQIDGNFPTTNYFTAANIDVGEQDGGASLRRTLIKFDLSSISPYAILSSATLRLYDTGDDFTANARLMNIYRVRRNWSSNVTWNTYDGTNNWTSAGASDTTNDIFADVEGSTTLPSPPVAGWIEITMSLPAITSWINGSVTNYGWLLAVQTQLNDMHRFYSTDNGSLRPELVLNYTLPGAGFLHISS